MRSLLSSGLFFFLELIYEHLITNNIQSLFFSCTLKTSLLNLTDFQYFWNCSIFEIYEIDIIIIYNCSAYMTETKFQMYFQKIYSFIKFRSLYTEFFQFKNWKNIIFLEILTFLHFKSFNKDHAYLQMLSFSVIVSYFIHVFQNIENGVL